MKKNTQLKIGLVILIILITLCIIGIFIIKNKRTKVDLNQFVTIQLSGYDGNGIAKIEFDEDSFKTWIADHLSENDTVNAMKNEISETADASGNYEGDSSLCKKILSTITYQLSKEKELSNGDTITASFDYDNESVKEYGIQFSGDDLTVTVSGLKEIQSVDPFENLIVDFTGIDGNIEAKVQNQSLDDYLDSLQFQIDQTNGLSIGDTINITLGQDEIDQAEENGYQFTQTSMSYQVEEISEYLDSLSDISNETLGLIKSNSNEIFTSQAEENGNYTYSNLQYEGCYLLVSKKEDPSYTNNILYVIYSVNLEPKSSDAGVSTQKVFVPIYYTNILKHEDGSLNIDYTSGTTLYHSQTISGTNMTYDYGYFSAEEMHDNLINHQKAEYDYEISKALQQYGK